MADPHRTGIDRRQLVASSAVAGGVVLAARLGLLAQTPTAGSPGLLATPGASPVASPVAGEVSAPSVPMFRGNAARTGEQLGPLPNLNEPIVLKWRLDIDEPDIVGQPVLANGTVIVTTDHYSHADGGNTIAINAESGQEVWRFGSGPSAHAWLSPAVVDNTVYIVTDQVYALDAVTGLERWRFAADPNPNGTSPVVADGIVYIQGFSMLQALDATSGEEIWRFTGGDVLTSTAPSVANGMIFVGDFDGTLYAIETAQGLERWRFSAADAIRATPTVVGDIVYFTSDDNTLYALNAQTGTEVWRYSSGFSYIWRFITVTNGRVYAVTEDPAVLALDALSGARAWRNDLDNDTVWSAPVVVDGVVFTVSGTTIRAIEADSGTLLGELSNDLLSEYTFVPIVVDGTAYVGWRDSFYAIGNLPAMTILADTALRGAPSSAGVERARLAAGTKVKSTGNQEIQGGFSWIEVSAEGVTGWIPLDTIDPEMLPPDDLVILYEP